MKKTLVALAVMAVAGSANALEVYNQDGVSVTLKGDMEVRYERALKKDSELAMKIDDADFAFDLRYAVNDDLKVGGFFEVQDTGTKEGDAYVGFYSASMGTLTLGRQATILDDYGIGSDYVFGIKSKVEDFDFSGSEVVKYQLDKGQFYGGVAVLQNKTGKATYDAATNKDAKLKDTDSTHIDANFGARFGDLDVQAFYGKTKGTKDDADLTIIALEAAYTIDALKLEALAGQNKLAMNAGGDVKTNIFGAAATYTMEAWTFSAAASNSKADTDGAESINDGYVNAGYALTKNVTAYGELGFTSDDTKDKTGYAVGIKATF